MESDEGGASNVNRGGGKEGSRGGGSEEGKRISLCVFFLLYSFRYRDPIGCTCIGRASAREIIGKRGIDWQ